MPSTRLDQLLLERGLCESRSLAQRIIMAGQVRVKGELVLKSSSKFHDDVDIEIVKPAPYVSRGGEKLASALDAFPVHVKGCVCADIGASTGGFTDCLLQHGAKRVYAIDVGKGILHWKLRQNPSVFVMEKTNVRYLDSLPEPVNLITIDVSFISLKIILPVIKNWFLKNRLMQFRNGQKRSFSTPTWNQSIMLVKPQFEAGKTDAAKGRGVIRDPKIHHRVLYDVLSFAQDLGFQIHDVIASPIKGTKGNIEFLTWLSYPYSNPETSILFDIEKDLSFIISDGE